MLTHLRIREAITELLVECAEHNIPTQVIWLGEQRTYFGTLEYRGRTDTFQLRVEDYSISFQAASVLVLNISEAAGLVVTVM